MWQLLANIELLLVSYRIIILNVKANTLEETGEIYYCGCAFSHRLSHDAL